MKGQYGAMMAMAAALVSGAALASGPGETKAGAEDFLPGSVMTYAVFETAIDHADLEACPRQFDPEQVFCRMTLAAEQAHVFVFAHDGEQPLLAVKHYDLDDEFLPF